MAFLLACGYKYLYYPIPYCSSISSPRPSHKNFIIHFLAICLYGLKVWPRLFLAVVSVLHVQGGFTPIGPVLTTATAVKDFDSSKRALTA